MTPAVYLTVQRTAFTPPAVFNNAVFSAFEQSLCDSHLSAVYVTTADGKIFDIKYPPKSDFLAHRQRSGRSALCGVVVFISDIKRFKLDTQMSLPRQKLIERYVDQQELEKGGDNNVV